MQEPKTRSKVSERIAEYEKSGFWDKDVEDDPETIVLLPDKIDYLGEKLKTRIQTRIANRAAVRFYEKGIRRGDFVIKSIMGLENFRAVKGGAVITCNHFSVFDNYAVWRAIRDEVPKGARLYKVIREGNYTNFKGIFGYFCKHCNVLPLSSNTETMKKFLNAVKVLLGRGEKILIYPEQAMWRNYRKPRPMKSGAFKLAAKNGKPVIPVFITQEDTERLDADGFPVQALTLWFLPAIYPDGGLSDRENADNMREENYKAWKEVYEREYKIPLVYGE